jgi:transposase
MGKALKIKDELSAEALRQEARRERDGRAVTRMYAIAHALDGLSRSEAARLAGMERQALRDAVMRYNSEGLAGLRDRPRGRPRHRLDAGEEAALAAAIKRGPDPDVGGCCAWTRADLCRWLETYGKTYHPSSMSRVLRSLGFSRQKAWPFHPKKSPEAQEAFN